MLHAHTSFDGGYQRVSPTESTADSTSRKNIVHSTFPAHGLPGWCRAHGCMWCQTEMGSKSGVITHSPGHEEVINTTHDHL